MPKTPFLFTLQQHLPADAFPWVVAALMHDPLVWRALHGELGERALETLDGSPTTWHPGALARLALEAATAPPAEEDAPLPPPDFASAARLALALQQFRQENGSWENLSAFLDSAPEAWQTPLACAFAWANDGMALLQTIAPMPKGVGVALDVLLSQPMPPGIHAVRLAEFLRRLPPALRLNAMWLLHARRPSLAEAAVPHVPLEGLPEPFATWQTAAHALAANDAERASQALSSTWETLRGLSGLLAFHQAQLAEEQGDLPTALTAWQQATSHAARRPEILARQILALQRARHTEEALALLPERPADPALLTAAAILHKAHPETSRRYALQALTRLSAVPDDMLAPLAETLRALGEVNAAAQAALALAHRRPTSTAALDMAAELALQAQMPAQAVEAAFLAHQIAPSTERLRRLAAAQEAAGMLAEALEHRRSLAQSEEATAEDHLALAALALRTNDHEEALRAAEAVLAGAPTHPRALTIKGRVLAQQGQMEAARRELEAAIAQRPAEAHPYLALAEVVAQTEGESAALDVLRTATHALPGDAELHYRLGERLLAAGQPGHAASALETAHRLASHRADIALALAKTHLALGENAKAQAILEPLYARQPKAEIARLLARAHLANGEHQAAIPLLAPLVQTPEATPQDLFAYGQALLETKTDPERAAHALQLALSRLPQGEQTSPSRAELLTALARAHLAQNRPEETLEAYRQAMQAAASNNGRMQAVIAEGLASVALRLERAEIALAALEDALASNPNNAVLRRLQAEAYFRLGFHDQAVDAGAEALRLGQHDPQSAMWYARLLLQLGRVSQAAEVLETSAARHPRHPEAALLLAKAYQALGKTRAALETLQPYLHESEAASPAWCAQAGQQFLALGEAETAAQCLQRAVSAENAPLDWHLHLVRALQEQDDFDEAIQVALQALQRETKDEDADLRVELHLAIVHSHIAQNHMRQAALALEHTQEIFPQHPGLLKEAIGLWRTLGELPKALQAAEDYLLQRPGDAHARLQAVHLARALLQPEAAERLLTAETDAAGEAPLATDAPEALLALLALRVAAALEKGEEVAAARWLNEGLRSSPRAAHLLALQARLTARGGISEEGQRLLEAAVTYAPASQGDVFPQTAHIVAWENIADAAAEMERWETARIFAAQVEDACPHSPAAALRLARLAVLRAETCYRCQAVEARTGCPPCGHTAGENAQHDWQQAIEKAARRLGLPTTPEAYANHPQLHRWYDRGVAAFQQRPTALLLRQPTAPDDLAAGVDALRRSKTAPHHLLPEPFRRHPLVRFHYALLLESQPNADLTQALKQAKRARAQRPHWAAAHFLVARIANQIGELAQAAEAISAALRLAPQEPRWHALAASIFAGLEQHAQAQYHLQEAVRLEPGHLPHHVALAETYLAEGEAEAALDVLQNALQHHADNSHLHHLLAQTFFRLGRLPEAAHHANKAVRGDRNAAAPMMLRIQIALAQQDARTALQLARRWLQNHPFHVEATEYAARALLALGEPQKALEIVEEAIPHAPDNMELNILRAELHRQVRGPKAAIDIWQSLLTSRPNVPTLWLGLAESLAASRQLEAAAAAAHKALRGLNKLSPQEQVRLHLLLGSIAKDGGHLDQAIYHFSEAVHIAPHHMESLLKLAQVQSDRGQYTEALATLSEAKRQNPNDSRTYYLAGLIYKTIHDYENAEAMFRKASQLAPDDFRIRRQLAAVSVINLLPS